MPDRSGGYQVTANGLAAREHAVVAQHAPVVALGSSEPGPRAHPGMTCNRVLEASGRLIDAAEQAVQDAERPRDQPHARFGRGHRVAQPERGQPIGERCRQRYVTDLTNDIGEKGERERRVIVCGLHARVGRCGKPLDDPSGVVALVVRRRR